MLGPLLALPAGAIALTRGFDGLYGQDAYAYFDYAVGSVRHSLVQLVPLEPFFWPPGYPLLVAATSLAIGSTPLAGQLVSLIAGALVPVCTWLLARELFPDQPNMALLAGALVALCGQLWQSSIVVMADTVGLALATFSAWALARYSRGGRATWLLAASAAIAFATLTRWIYGLVAIPFAVYALGSVARRRALLPALTALAVAVVIAAPVVGPSLVGLVTHPGMPAAFAGNFQVYSWSPINAFRRDFLTPDGHLQYTLPNGVYYAIAPLNLAYFGPLLAIWLLPGVWAARCWPRPVVLLIGGWAAIVYAFHAGAPWQNFRFALAYLPPLAIIASAGVLELHRYLRGVSLRRLVVGCVIVGLASQAVSGLRLVETFIDRKNEDVALVRWVESQAPQDSQLLTFGPTLTFRHYSRLPTFDLFELQTPADLEQALAQPAPRLVLVDEGSIESQWLDQPPATNFHLLRDQRGLTRVGTDGSYTLYRVNSG